MFWNLVGTETICDNDNLAKGLRRHMTIRPFVNALMQIGTAQQTYLALPGCGKCDRNQCAITCHVQLLRRVLAGSGTALRLLPVVQGFIPRTYTRAVVAYPTRDAQPLDGTFLADAAWGDARLTQVWVGTKTTLRVVAVLRAGVDGPDLRARLFAHGWVTVGWASTLLAKRPAAAQLAVPPLVIGGAAYRHDPYLLLPVRGVTRTDPPKHAGAGILPVLHVRQLAAPAPAEELAVPAEQLATAHTELIESVGEDLLIEQVTALAATFVQEELAAPAEEEELVTFVEEEPFLSELPVLVIEELSAPADELPVLVIEELAPAAAIEQPPTLVVVAEPVPPTTEEPVPPTTEEPVPPTTEELLTLVIEEPAPLAIEGLPAAIEGLPALVVAEPAPATIEELPAPVVVAEPAPAAVPPAEQLPAIRLTEEPSALVLGPPAPAAIEELPIEQLPAVREEPTAAHTALPALAVDLPIAEPAAPVLPWPNGPGTGGGRLSAEALGAFFAKLLASDSSYYSAQEPGISRKRMPLFIPDTLSEHGRTILVWLDVAGLLVPPANPNYPWARPRRLTTEDLAEIAARLALVSFPTGSDLVMAKKQGM